VDDKSLEDEKLERAAEELADWMIQTINSLLEKQFTWQRQYDSLANRDQLITRAERIVAQKLEHRADRAEAMGEDTDAYMFDVVCDRLLPLIIQRLRAKR